MLTFLDSFDHYTDLNTKYDSVGASNQINNNGTSRTGPQNLQIVSGAAGPAKTMPQTLRMLVSSAYYSSGTGRIYILGNEGAAGSGFQGGCVELFLNGNGSLSAQRGPSAGGTVLGTSAAGLFAFNTYNSLALECTVGAAGIVNVWCNGVLVLALTNVDTRNLHNPARAYLDCFALWGPGGTGQTAYHDDVYVLDTTASPHTTYLGALRVFESVPDADGSVQWTPSAGSNFQNVDTIPPNTARNNSSSTLGQVDQYLHPLNVAVPANSTIFGVQHSMLLQVDSGARSVVSDVAGVVAAGPVALSSGFKFYSWPYDNNPTSGNPWNQNTDFPLLAGPDVAA